MSPRERLERQWIPMLGGSCDVRMGNNALMEASSVFADCVGKPRRCMVVIRPDEDADVRELLRRQLVNAGFSLSWYELEDGGSATLEASCDLARAMADAQMTADDLCCAYGDADLMSVTSHVCDGWCGGVSLAAVPTSETAFVKGVLDPLPLAVGAKEGMVFVRATARHAILDFGRIASDVDSEEARYIRSLMVATAMASSEREFSELWDRAESIMAGDYGETKTQLIATARSRGQLLSSTAVAVRQSVGYGEAFARALGHLTGDTLPKSVLLAEGLRFCARVSVATGKLSIDDMLAQDELLEALSVGVARCDVSGEELAREIRDEEFRTSNRLLLLVPIAIGRVRHTTLEDGVLEEHARAWCDAHR